MKNNNKLIAEFMGYKPARCNNGMAWNTNDRELHKTIKIQGRLITPDCNYLEFSSSWEWLMLVVEKIELLGYEVLISRIACQINEIMDRKNPISSFVCGDPSKKIEITYDCIVRFVKWYNKKTTK